MSTLHMWYIMKLSSCYSRLR